MKITNEDVGKLVLLEGTVHRVVSRTLLCLHDLESGVDTEVPQDKDIEGQFLVPAPRTYRRKVVAATETQTEHTTLTAAIAEGQGIPSHGSSNQKTPPENPTANL